VPLPINLSPLEFITTVIFKISIILLAVGAIAYGWYRNDLRRLVRDYSCKEPFDGDLEHCIVRFPLDEAGTDCMLGADRNGLYMSSSIEARESNRKWSFRYYVIKTPILIPWSSLRISDARFPLRGHLRFDVPSNKATFFVTRQVGQLLLAKAGRSLP
jgi:hypothetical protein